LVTCPYRGYEGESELLKTWKFGFYEVERPHALSAVEFSTTTRGLTLKGEEIRVRNQGQIGGLINGGKVSKFVS